MRTAAAVLSFTQALTGCSCEIVLPSDINVDLELHTKFYEGGKI